VAIRIPILDTDHDIAILESVFNAALELFRQVLWGRR